MSQTEEEIKEEKGQKGSDFFHPATEYFSEKSEAAKDLEKDEKRILFIETTNTNEDMIVANRIAINDWYVNDKLNVKMSDEIKRYFDNLIKKAIEA